MKIKWRSAGAALIIVLTVVAYIPAMRGGFVWDDDDHLTANPAMTAPDGLQMIWTSLAVSRYYPLTLTSFWVQHRLWGLNPLPYHVVNIAFHAINGVLVYFVLRRLRVPAAWLAAALWTLHPVNVESVAWITELKNTQSGCFFFCALLCYLRFEEEGNRRGRLARRWYALALLCGAGAFLSKPSTVVLPAALLLCAWWQRGSWRRSDFVRTAPFFALALVMSAWTIVEQRGHIARVGTSDWSLGIAKRFIVAGKDIWFYAGKTLWPANLAFVYPRWETAVNSAESWAPLVGIVAGGAVLWMWRRQPWGRAGLFGIGFFVVALLPVLGFVDVFYFRYSFVADHFQYLASLGIVGCVAAGMARLLDRRRLWLKPAGNAVCVALLATLAVLTWKQGHVYRDSETLWRDTLAKNPKAFMAHNNLGYILDQTGRIPEAIDHFEEALRLSTGLEGHNNLGDALFKLGRGADAVAQYEQALHYNPDSPAVHFNMGTALRQLGRLTEAIGEYEQALRLRPDYPEAHNNLGLALEDVGRGTEAVGHYREALRLRPDFPEAHNNLGLALQGLGRETEAAEHYREALRLRPDFPEAHNNLGNVLFDMGKMSKAVGEYEEALRLRPDYAEARNNLGNALSELGRIPEAIRQYELALVLKPDYAEAHYDLGAALEQAGRVREAVGHYEQALRIRPDFAAARNRLARLRAAQ